MAAILENLHKILKGLFFPIIMLKRILNYFKKPTEIDEAMKEIELSKINKHANFLLRKDLGDINKQIQIKISEINQKKEEALHELRLLHKKQLMNKNIPPREVNIMDGNRDHYIKSVAHFITNIDTPKNYIENYDYCTQFPQQIKTLYIEVEKNILVLSHFFENEVKNVNRKISELADIMSYLKNMFERNNIENFREMDKGIIEMKKNIHKINELQSGISEEKENIRINTDKINRLKERINTITSGADYRTLESFKEEKEEIDTEYKKKHNEIDKRFMEIETSLKKYSYRHPDKKIAKQYLESPSEALAKDTHLEIVEILKEIHKEVESGEIELKDKKKEHCIDILKSMNMEYLKEHQTESNKLEDRKKKIQTKITHNSASLNLSEQEYWSKATEDRIEHHQAIINKLQKDIDMYAQKNMDIEAKIKNDIEKILGEEVIIINDLTEE
jgi:hypothetical protein